jgi:ribonuclease E
MPKEMLINVAEGEECRIALLDDGHLEELYMERTSAASHVGNIYKGRVTNVEASIQAAFVDFGVGRNGFLHISDLLPTYFGQRNNEDVEEYVGKKMARRDRPPIQRCLRRGDEIIVQVIKEGIGTKGPTLSSYLSISGKMLVMMPGVAGRGVSKKIEDEDERRRLKRILVDLQPPEDCGFIIRTEAVDKDREEIERDLNYLSRLWDQIKHRRDAGPTPAELYTEGDLVTRTVRDVFSSDVERVIVDHPDVAERVRDVIRISSPRGKDRVEVYDDVVPLFSRYGIEAEIEQMYSRHVPLPSGGSLVIDSTEAVVTIDVNSGKMREHNDAEMTAFKTDMEAAEEIPRQLKLRDLGGVIICDFIDLRYERHRRELEERLFENFKMDRAKTKVLRMSQFGIIELTRQRMRPSLKRSIYSDCPHCKGAGLVKTPESMALDLMRRLAIAVNDMKVVRAELSVCGDVAFHMLNKKRAAIAELESRTGKRIEIRVDPSLGLDEQRFELFDNRDGVVILEEIGMTVPDRAHVSQLGVKPAGHTSQGRGGRGGGDRGAARVNGSRGGRRPDRPRMEPARALAVEDDDGDPLDEDDRQAIARGEADVEDRERRQGREADDDDDRRLPAHAREADRTDMPAILETEAGDEAADELADEEVGFGQGDEAGTGDAEDVRAEDAPPPGDQPPGEGGGRRRRRRRRRRGRGGQQPVNPNDPRGTSSDFQGGPGRPANGGTGRDGFAADRADRVADEDDDDGAEEPNGNVADSGGVGEGTFSDVEPADAIGPATEGGDSIAEDDLNTAFTDGPHTPGGTGGEGDRPRRRRRRGGRRHRRRGEGEPTTAESSPPAHEPMADPVLADDADAGGVVVLTDADALPVGTSPGEAAEAERVVDEATVEIVAEADAPGDEPVNEPSDEVPDEQPAAAAPKSRRRPTSSRAKATPAKPPKAAKVAKTAKAKVAKPVAPKRGSKKKVGTEVAEAAEVVPTGSADTHVVEADVAEELVEAEPASRPRSFSDLDAIPDDFD